MNSVTNHAGKYLLKSAPFCLVMILTLYLFAPVFSQEISQTLLTEGIKSYEDGDLDQAIVKLSSCLEIGQLKKEQQALALKYLAQAYLAKDNPEQAKATIKVLLKIMPGYRPDPIQDRPQYIQMVKQVRRELASEQVETGAGTSMTAVKWLAIVGWTTALILLIAL